VRASAEVDSRERATAANTTRNRILAVSLDLFNREGLAAVSTHRIATESEISGGNLHYHFKTKELVVTTLYRRFEDGLAPGIEAAESAQALDDLWLSLQIMFETIERYRFIYRDMDHLLNEYRALEPRARALTERCLLAMRKLCTQLALVGVIDADEEDIEMLAMQIVFATTCWFSFKRLTPHRAKPEHAESALAAYYTLSLLSPYVLGASRDYLNFLRAKYLGRKSRPRSAGID
jgi:AcrR family transcriptional regulator